MHFHQTKKPHKIEETWTLQCNLDKVSRIRCTAQTDIVCCLNTELLYLFPLSHCVDRFNLHGQWEGLCNYDDQYCVVFFPTGSILLTGRTFSLALKKMHALTTFWTFFQLFSFDNGRCFLFLGSLAFCAKYFELT